MRRLVILLMGLWVIAPAAQAQSRGELLYTTHCIACHTTQMHWRDQRAASDWPRLKAQVRRWQGATSLAWSDSDILEVARYLNDTFYRFEMTADVVSTSSLGEGVPSAPVASSTGRSAIHRVW